MKTILFYVSFLVLFFLIFKMSYSQVTEEWVKEYNSSGDYPDIGNSICVDDSNNVYITGHDYSSLSGYDFITIKYSMNGNQVWIKRYNGTANSTDVGKKIYIDSQGNIYCIGYSANTGTGLSDITTIKYNKNGDQLWVRNYNGPGNGEDVGMFIAFDVSNNVYVTGYSTGNGTGLDYVTLKYSSNGSLQWSRRYNGTANGLDVPYLIAVDLAGNLCVTGRSAGTGVGEDITTIKYNSLGDSLWVKKYNGPVNGNDVGTGLCFDNSGNVYVSGSIRVTGTVSDIITIKYAPNGDSLWVKKYNGPINGNDYVIIDGIKIDNSGNVIVVGGSQGPGAGFAYDFVTLKYNSNGDTAWARRYNVTDDYPYAMVLDTVGNIYVTGHLAYSSSNRDYGIIKYNPDGNLEWSKTFSWIDDRVFGIAIDKLRNVYITGGCGNYSSNSIHIFTIRYSQQVKVNAFIEGIYNQISNLTLRDTVRGYLRYVADPDSVADSAIYYLQTDGTAYFRFHKATYGQYYLQIKHRNSIETWSKAIYPFQTMTFDFTTDSCQAYGCNQIKKGSKWCIYSGDVNQDCVIDATDLGLVDNDAFLGVGGYVKADLNGDFFVDGTDLSIVDNNASRFITCFTP